jgi:hypothetical protein
LISAIVPTEGDTYTRTNRLLDDNREPIHDDRHPGIVSHQDERNDG